MDNKGFTDIGLPNGTKHEPSNGTIVCTNNDDETETRTIQPFVATKSTKSTPSTCSMSYIRNRIISGLEDIFYKFGMFVAKHPYPTIIISIIIPALLSIGIVKFRFDEDFADLLLPPSSRIHEDRKWVSENVQYEQRPIRLILKNANVLTKESILALYDFHTQITSLQADGNMYEDLCVRIGSFCFVDSLLALWQNNIDRIQALTNEDILYAVNTITTNPTYFFPFNATRMLGLIERNSSDHIVSAGVMHADWFIQSSNEAKPLAKDLEYQAIDLALNGHPQFSMVNVFTIDSYDEEFFDGVYGDIILIVYGFPVVLLYIILGLGKFNFRENGVFLTIAAIVGVVLSTGACFGVGFAAGFLFGAPHQALIFLLLAVGVDDAFVIVTYWKRINKAHASLPIEERIAITMRHSGVSITVTSCTDLVAFACGISTQMPVLRSFCVYCSVGIFFLFMMQSTLFPACLTLNQYRIERNPEACASCVASNKEFIRPFFKNYFGPALLSTPGKIITILVTIGIAILMGVSVSRINKGFEVELSLPEDSYVRHFLHSQRKYFTDEGPGIQVFCGPMDYQKNIMVLDAMAKNYTESEYILFGLVANWIPLYQTWVKLKNFGGNFDVNEDGIPTNETLFYTILKEYLETPFGLPFSKYIDLTDEEVPSVKWAYFPMQQIVSTDVWENERIMEEVRRIADVATSQLSDGKCFCYSFFHIFTEVIRYVDTEIMRNFILAGIAVFVVTLLLIVDFVASAFVLLSVCLTTLNIMGSLHLWGFYLDVNLVVLLIISIGLAVDFSAHIGYTFMTLTGTRRERAINTLDQIGPAILHGAVTTFLVFFVLVFGRSLSAFFAVFILVVLFGLFHGLCFLPVMLSIVGSDPYYNAGPDGTVPHDRQTIIQSDSSASQITNGSALSLTVKLEYNQNNSNADDSAEHEHVKLNGKAEPSVGYNSLGSSTLEIGDENLSMFENEEEKDNLAKDLEKDDTGDSDIEIIVQSDSSASQVTTTSALSLTVKLEYSQHNSNAGDSAGQERVKINGKTEPSVKYNSLGSSTFEIKDESSSTFKVEDEKSGTFEIEDESSITFEIEDEKDNHVKKFENSDTSESNNVLY